MNQAQRKVKDKKHFIKWWKAGTRVADGLNRMKRVRMYKRIQANFYPGDRTLRTPNCYLKWLREENL